MASLAVRLYRQVRTGTPSLRPVRNPGYLRRPVISLRRLRRWHQGQRRHPNLRVDRHQPVMNARTALALLIFIASCAGPLPSAPESPPGSATAPRVCAGREGSVVDIATEPPWREFSDYRDWWTADGGCLLRIDVIADRQGPEHCGYEKARVMITGIPVGNRYTNQRDAVEFVRDPDNAQRDAETSAAFDPDAQLPDVAEDTGYRTTETELWVDPTDGSGVYLVRGDRVERWPRDPTPAVCS